MRFLVELSVLVVLGLGASTAYRLPTLRAPRGRRAAAAAVRLQLEGLEVGDNEREPTITPSFEQPAPMKIVADETYGLMLSTLMKTEESISGQISANYAHGRGT